MQKGLFRILALLALASIVDATGALPSAFGCTTFLLKHDNDFVIGKNYDWFRGLSHGALFTNARNLKKKALNITSREHPAEWVSKYGSITFTQFGRELPISGINEKGLVVEILKLNGSKYNSSEINKPFVNESQFAQYILDNFATVEEIQSQVDTLRVEKAFAGLHYFVCDIKANCKIFEFLEGKLQTYEDKTLPIPALTNDPYENLIKSYEATEDQVRHTRVAIKSSMYRFWKTSQMLRTSGEILTDTHNNRQNADDKLKAYGYAILDAVQIKFGPSLDGIGLTTQWRLLYHPRDLTISFETRESMKLKTLRIQDFNFDCHSQGRMLDMNSDFSGSVTSHLVDYNTELNSALIDKNNKIIPDEKLAAAKSAAAMSACLESGAL